MINQFSSCERPRERLARAGAEFLSLRELLAVLLGSGPKGKGCMGVAADILARNAATSEADQERAFFLSLEAGALAQLTNISGLGTAGKARIGAAFELGRRYAQLQQQVLSAEASGAPVISLSGFERKALSGISASLRSAKHEWFGFVPLHLGDRIGSLCIVEKGARTHVNVDTQELFARILGQRPVGVMLFHNHPSGSLRPSVDDQQLTVRIATLLEALEIEFLGHIIVSAHGWGRIECHNPSKSFT